MGKFHTGEVGIGWRIILTNSAKKGVWQYWTIKLALKGPNFRLSNKSYLSCMYCCNLMCICLSHLYLLYLMFSCCILWVFVVTYVYLLYYVCIAILTLDDGLLARSRIRKVLRPATSTQVFLGFPVSTSKCWDGSQVSKLLLHASHVALPT